MEGRVRVALYSRVSTFGQNADGQEAELNEYAKKRGWEVQKTYRDKMSGAARSRPALDQLMADANRGKFDVVLVWRFDRFARSVSHLLQALETFKEFGIDFVSVSEQIDTATAAGKLVFTVLAAVAEVERSVIRERVKMGVENARRKGKRLGRPPIKVMSATEVQTIRDERLEGATFRDLARRHQASIWAVYRAAKSTPTV